jgi:hypothetical protein
MRRRHLSVQNRSLAVITADGSSPALSLPVDNMGTVKPEQGDGGPKAFGAGPSSQWREIDANRADHPALVGPKRSQEQARIDPFEIYSPPIAGRVRNAKRVGIAPIRLLLCANSAFAQRRQKKRLVAESQTPLGYFSLFALLGFRVLSFFPPFLGEPDGD